jgi:hypothetical protein
VHKDLPANILLSKKENINRKYENSNANCYWLLLFSAALPALFPVLNQARAWAPDERYWARDSRAACLNLERDLTADVVLKDCLEPRVYYPGSDYMDLLIFESDLGTVAWRQADYLPAG